MPITKKSTKIPTFVYYGANRYGYTVQTIQAGELLAEYSQGNAHGDSISVLDPGTLGTVDEKTLRKWARQSALDTAKEAGIPRANVIHDPDLRGDEDEKA